ncbi:hypothetical protein AB4212_41560, partial [Streptomyces sp. 2MCAF27]
VVGKTVLRALDTSQSLAEAARDVPEIARLAARHSMAEPVGSGPQAVREAEDWLEPSAVARACAYGGGPGGDTIGRALAELRADLEEARAEVEKRRTRWTAGAAALDQAVERLGSPPLGSSVPPPDQAPAGEREHGP